MSVQSPPLADPHALLLQNVWVDCLRTVLNQVAGFAVSVEVESAEEPPAAEPAPAPAEPAPAGPNGDAPQVWALLAVSKALGGEMAVATTEAGAVQLSQMLTSEPPDAAAAFDAARREAFDELVRMVAGQVATSLKGAAGGDVDVKLSGSAAPAWQGAPRLGMRLAGEKIAAPIRVGLFVSPELAASFKPPAEPDAAALPPDVVANAFNPARGPEHPAAAVAEIQNPNLELLLDVALDATLCFGQKQMLLRDILELHPGAAVVLDRHVEEPVDLLVGGRMVARGEVVIVDGNYGLRITEIVSPQQRIAFLAK